MLSLISAIGLGLGKVHICGISLGVTFVFFAGILAGHFGLSIDPQMLNYAESFGLVIFVYALGYVEKIDADVLARICYILDCNPGDIILYKVSDE